MSEPIPRAMASLVFWKGIPVVPSERPALGMPLRFVRLG
ncbi:hypothetical protein Marky_0985 [Marinithermus hydrothermalis DSM 14884]|uniref:Uncharacterized protein n=1 Tax=Marinithermus hydrothermalis (strain DSM 14884 / JCM 11576 / T1) TaxID=869210 RepID=F2NLA9_MARHT|nr:hypothetical protein Marky_0985 [Marinithermus hydrothermalis DSM 14884]